MIRVCFQNGPEAPETVLVDEEFETVEEARKRLPLLLHAYSTVPDAVIWLEGDEKPAFATAEPEPEPEAEPEPEPEPEPEAGDVAAADEKPSPRSTKKK